MKFTNIPQNPPSSDFPSDVLKWLKNNCQNPRAYLKLFQTCKYFQPTKSYFLIRSIVSHMILQIYYEKEENGKIICVKDLPKNLWITEEFMSVAPVIPISDIIPKIGFCEAKKLWFVNQKLLFEEYKILTAGKRVESLRLENSTLKHANGDDVFFEDLMKFLPKIKNLYLAKMVPSIESLQAAKDATSPTLASIEIRDFPENFDILKFLQYYEYLPHIHIKINHQLNHKTAELQAFVDKVIQKGVTKYQPPEIDFLHQTPESKESLSALCPQFSKNVSFPMPTYNRNFVLRLHTAPPQ